MARLIQIVSGPNGSGKTTFAETFLVKANPAIPFLNPDLIAIGLGPADFERASFHAGRLLLKEIRERISRTDSFAFESTLSGLTYARMLKNARALGYKVEIYFLFLDKISLNKKRIRNRAALGGHFIPSKVVQRRHLRCFHNFWNIYRHLSDNWSVLDNSNSKPLLVQTKLAFDASSELEKKSFSQKFLKGHV